MKILQIFWRLLKLLMMNGNNLCVVVMLNIFIYQKVDLFEPVFAFI